MIKKASIPIAKIPYEIKGKERTPLSSGNILLYLGH
jgi:hypothetical protein